MVLQCLAWIPVLWNQLVNPFITLHKSKRRGFVSTLPDNDYVIISILSKLPAECVLKCRRVCRQWRDLTSTPYFAQLHIKEVATRASQLLFVQCSYWKYSLNLFIFDDSVIKKVHQTSQRITGQCDTTLVGSCNGLLLFTEAVEPLFCYIFNPVTQEHVRLSIPFPAQPGRFLCGFFFHPLTSKYEVLYVHRRGGSCIEYFICCLETKMWRQLITSFAYLPLFHYPPAIVNGALHWMVDYYDSKIHESDSSSFCTNAIMVFTMDAQDFHAMPHPGNYCHSRPRHGRMRLLEMNEQLCLCNVCSGDKLVVIWVLEDYANWVWVRRYVVDLVWDERHFPYEKYCPRPSHFNYHVWVLNIQNGELLLFWLWRGLFWCNMELNTVRKINTTGMKLTDLVSSLWRTTAYTKSLVTFK